MPKKESYVDSSIIVLLTRFFMINKLRIMWLAWQVACIKAIRNANRYHILIRKFNVKRQTVPGGEEMNVKIDAIWFMLGPGGVILCSL